MRNLRRLQYHDPNALHVRSAHTGWRAPAATLRTIASGREQLLEAKDNLQRMLAAIPLSVDERSNIDEGHALDNPLEQLIDIPPSTGTTPREIGVFPQPRPCYRSSPPNNANENDRSISDSTE
ncbi:hypothetical protein [Rhodococcus koreensis]